MANSTFTLYSSGDAGSPALTGLTGSLITLLDACLVTGYGSKASAGWSKPIANINSGSVGVVGCYKNASGSAMTLVVNDSAPNATAAGKEAWMTGWESLAGITGSSKEGAGTGQFPTPAQLLTTGHVVCRKSTTADNAVRTWQVFADQNTFYLSISTNDVIGTYYSVMFGDIFSLKGNTDLYRCILIGRAAENSTGGSTAGSNAGTPDCFDACFYRSDISNTTALIGSGMDGHYMPRSFGGGGSSIKVGKTMDMSVAINSGISIFNTQGNPFPFAGAIQTPNTPDNTLYLSPIRISEPGSGTIRGRLRGFFQICHPASSFSDGQTFAGGGDYAGKSFIIVKQGTNAGFWAMETSNTVETN
jgi:hypothetical protein